MVGVCAIVGISLIVNASLNFLLTPMLDGLGLSEEQGSMALTLPSIGSLIVVFIAGRLGDRIGHRRIILVASAAFIAGSIIVAAAQGMLMVTIGLILAGASATAILIVSLGLLQVSIPSGPSRVSAFTTFGMVFPIAYLIVPVVTGWTVNVASWRFVPASWVLLGLLMPVIALRLLGTNPPLRPVGEMWTPVLGGLLLAGFVQTLHAGHNFGWLAPRTLAMGSLTIAIAAATFILLKRFDAPSLTLRPVRDRVLAVLLACVVLIVMVNTLVYVTLALEYLYSDSVLSTAIQLVPAQAAAIVGAKAVAAPLMRRYGAGRAGAIAMLGLALSLATLMLMGPTSPSLQLVISASLFSMFGFASITTLSTAVMAQAPAGEEGVVSAFRAAASSVGSALTVVLLGGMIGLAVDAVDYEPLGDLPDPAAMVDGLKASGLVGAVVAIIAAIAFARAMRWRTLASATSSPG